MASFEQPHENDNPAYRLWLLLIEGHAIPANQTCKAALAQLFGVPKDSPELIIRLGKAMKLPDQAIAALKQDHPDDLEVARHWEVQINNAFVSLNFEAPWQTFVNKIDTHALNYLKGHAKVLNGGKHLKPLDLDTVFAAREALVKVLEDVITDEGMTMAVRQALVRNLRALISALEEYKLTGSTEVLDSISVFYGRALFDKAYGAAVHVDTPVGHKLFSILGGLADSMTVFLGLPQLSGAAKSYLLLANSST